MPPSKHRQTGENRGFRIIAHLARENSGARVVSDVSWSDMWSIRLYITLSRGTHCETVSPPPNADAGARTGLPTRPET